MSPRHTDGVALQPPCGAEVVLAGADVIQPCEGDILVAERAVPQKRLLNPLGRGADGVVPAVVGTCFGEGSILLSDLCLNQFMSEKSTR
jgi:hypothetical protein